MYLKKIKTQISGCFLDYCMGIWGYKIWIFMLYIHLHNMKSQNNGYRSMCVREEKPQCMHLWVCFMYANKFNCNQTANNKLLLYKAWTTCIDYFLQFTFFKHIFLMFQFKIIHPSYSLKISGNNNNNNNNLLLIIATAFIKYLLWVRQIPPPHLTG